MLHVLPIFRRIVCLFSCFIYLGFTGCSWLGYSFEGKKLANVVDIPVPVLPAWNITNPTTLPETTPATVIFNSKMYAIWSSPVLQPAPVYTNYSSPYKIRAAVYNGNDTAPNWIDISGNAERNMNRNASAEAHNPRLAVFNSKLYAIWDEMDLTTNKSQIRTAVYNGNDSSPAWTFVDKKANPNHPTVYAAGAPNGLNFDSTDPSYHPLLIVYNSKLYAAWQETILYRPVQLRVAVYNGDDSAPVWKHVDTYNWLGINKSMDGAAHYVKAAVLDSKLYLTWREGNPSTHVSQIRVAVYNGDDDDYAWTFIDGNGPNGLNRDVLKNGNNPEIIAYNSKLYVAWSEDPGNWKGQVRISVYDPANPDDGCKAIDDELSSDGLNRDPGRGAWTPTFAIYNGKLIATWVELGGNWNYKSYVAYYNGDDDAPEFTTVDGETGDGINKFENSEPDQANLTVFGSKLYLIWSEKGGSPFYGAYQALANPSAF